MEAKDFVNKRTGLGIAAFGFVGFLFGGPAGAGIGALVGAALANVSPPSRKGEMTPERQSLYNAAMNSTSSPAELRELAESFESEGLKAEAEMLRKRAELRELPKEVRDQRRQAYRQMVCSDDVDAISEMATAFATEGALGSATGLRQHAADVRAAHEAGKSAKPMPDPNVINAFADKLAKAIYHFKPQSREAQTAAANLIRARGMAPTPNLVAQAIAACVEEMDIPTEGGAQAAPPEGATAPSEEEAPSAVAPPEGDEGAPEEDPPVGGAPSVVGSEDEEVARGEEPIGPPPSQGDVASASTPVG